MIIHMLIILIIIILDFVVINTILLLSSPSLRLKLFPFSPTCGIVIIIIKIINIIILDTITSIISDVIIPLSQPFSTLYLIIPSPLFYCFVYIIAFLIIIINYNHHTYYPHYHQLILSHYRDY